MVEQCGKIKQARRCVACGEKTGKRQLLRVVRTAEGIVQYDVTGHANGRGAYICANEDCIEKAQKKGIFEVDLKAKASVTLYIDLKKAVSNG